MAVFAREYKYLEQSSVFLLIYTHKLIFDNDSETLFEVFIKLLTNTEHYTLLNDLKCTWETLIMCVFLQHIMNKAK